jgi:hypothetical protein
MSGDSPSTTPIVAGGACTEPTNLRPAPDRDKGIEAFLLDRPREAVDLLTIAVKNDPRDRAAEAFRAAAQAKLDEGRTRALDDVAGTRRVSLESIPLAHIERKVVPLGDAATKKVQLTKSSETKNLITDTADWESKNQLKSNARHQADLPAYVPPKLGQMERLRAAFQHADHVAAIYDTTILIASEGKRALSFDTRMVRSRGPRPFEIPFAQLVGSALIVELAYNGYAKDSNGRNGYFAAFDAKDGTLMWATDPLVANAHEALISGGSIITGYGFTAEPDFLFVLDLATGKVDQKIPLKSGPSFIRKNGDRLFVRTYDMDYVFKPSPGSAFAPAPAANLSGAESASSSDVPPPDAETKCWVRRATAAILARDAQAIHEANERLKPISRDRVLDELLRIEEKKAAMVSTSGRLDLTTAPLIAVAAPPWDATPPKPQAAGGKIPRLVKVTSKTADPVRNMHPAFEPGKPWFIAPIKKGQLPEGARQDIPTSFGQEDLRAIIPDQRGGNERSILIYGGRYLALIKDSVAERMFDLETLRHPPKANPQWKEFAIQDATYAQERDGVLYVCNGGGSYAKEVFGKKGFLTALDVATGKLLWRSAPLTCNSTFAMTNDGHIISGYGFTAEPDFVFLVRRSDGSIIQRFPIDTGPESITLTGTQVHVETYGHVVDFDLK